MTAAAEALRLEAARDTPEHGLALRTLGPSPRWRRQVVHGTPITPLDRLSAMSPTGFCITYRNRVAISPYIAKLHHDSVLILDNGAYGEWTAAGCPDAATSAAKDWTAFYCWAWKIMQAVPQAVLVIPDVIGGNIAANQRLMLEVPPEIPIDRCLPVWHLDEQLDHLAWIIQNFGMVAFGSAGRYRTPGTLAWRQKMHQATNLIEEICADPNNGIARARVHMLRGLGPMRDGEWALASGDSTNLARNHAKRAARWGGIQGMQAMLEARRYPEPCGPIWPEPTDGQRPSPPQRRIRPLQLPLPIGT